MSSRKEIFSYQIYVETKMTKLNSLKTFTSDTKGNMAVIFAIALMMIMAALGVAVDYGMAQRAKVKLQNSADAAVLAAAKTGENNQPKLLNIAKKVVGTHDNDFNKPVATKLKIDQSGTVQVELKTVYDTFIMGLFGRDTLNIGAIAEAPLSSSEPVNIALVLDTTGSMQGSKLASLKTAANNLVDTLGTYKNPSLKISVVPFGQYVNVGLGNRNAPWIDVPADKSSTGTPTCGWKKKVVGYQNCHIVHDTCYNDGTPYACSWQECDEIYGPKEWKCTTPTQTSKWYGCVGSRLAPWHQRVAYSGKKIPGLMNVKCGAEMRPLTGNMNQVKATINAMNAKGFTYIPSGLMWGWRTLDTNMPLTEAAGPYANKTQKVMILMSDGANTRSKKNIKHNGWNVASANQDMKKLCNKIKAEEIEIYTIAYDITDPATKNRMKNCATDASKYYDASNAKALNDAFQSIAANLVKLRLTH